MNAYMISDEAETILDGSDKKIENARHQVSNIMAAALALETSAYELAEHLETAKIANMINMSAYLQRFAERCESDLCKTTSRL